MFKRITFNLSIALITIMMNLLEISENFIAKSLKY